MEYWIMKNGMYTNQNQKQNQNKRLFSGTLLFKLIEK